MRTLTQFNGPFMKLPSEFIWKKGIGSHLELNAFNDSDPVENKLTGPVYFSVLDLYRFPAESWDSSIGSCEEDPSSLVT